MSVKSFNSLIFRRKYKWQLLRPLFKKRRGSRRASYTYKVLNLSATNRYTLFKKKIKSIKNLTKISNLKSNATYLINSSNFISNNSSYSDTKSSFNCHSIRNLVFILANSNKFSKLATLLQKNEEHNFRSYKLVSAISSLTSQHTLSPYNRSSLEYSKSTKCLNLLNLHSDSIWKRALSINSKLSLKQYPAGLVSSDGYLPIIYLPNNFSKLQKRQKTISLASSSNLLSRTLLSSTINSKNIRTAARKDLILRACTQQNYKKKLLKLFRLKSHLNKNLNLLNNNLHASVLTTGFRNSISSAVVNSEIKSRKLLPDNKPFKPSLSSYFNKEAYNFSTNYNTSRFLQLNFRKKPLATYSNNIYPNISLSSNALRTFRPLLSKDLNFNTDVSPWVNDAIVRFIENCSGKRALFQYSTRVENMVDSSSKLRYRLWIQRMSYYERNLGHRFFMEEALHIIHLSFRYHDVNLFSSWLKAIIMRISFWKTRSIFRFLKYVFNNYYRFVFDDLSIKGIKIRLKGKISAAGNSRKRTILFRSGKNSHSQVNIKCVHDFKTITTFSGAMGFQVWMFY